MSRRDNMKGQITPLDLLLVAVVFFIGVGFFLLLNILSAKDVIISKQTIYVSMEQDDRGSGIVSLLGATSGGDIMMEVAGDTVASGYESNITDSLKAFRSLKNKIFPAKTLVLPGERIGPVTQESHDSYKLQVPLPGARKGDPRGQVEMIG